jgi:hypothetical protein
MANFIKAGNIAVRKAVAARKALADSKADLSKIGKEAITQDAYNVKATADRNSKAAITKTNADTAKKGADMKRDYEKDIAGIEKGGKKAGMLAAGVGMLGVGAIQMNKPEEVNEELAMIDAQRNKVGGQLSDNASATANLEAKLKALQGTKAAPETAPVPQGDQSTVASTLAGGQKVLADAIAGPESGQWGYQAFNQGGADGGTTVLGKSGSYKEHFGKDLTKMSVQQVMDLQYDDKSMSDDQWRSSGKIHAAGRYQFIGSTLRDEVSQMGLDTSRMFDAGTQDEIFLSHAKRAGNISPWIGPSTKYSQAKKDELNGLIQGL